MMRERFFKLFTGPMWSSKTTHLLLELEKAKYQGREVALFKPQLDDRYNKSDVVSHAGYSWPAVTVHNCEEMLEYIAQPDIEFDTIAVDEAFMIHNVSEMLILLFREGYNILVSSLDLSSQLKEFQEIKNITGFATHIHKLAAVCAVCKSADARYTYKKTTPETDMMIQVGGNELYEPRCYACHPLMVKL